jgi:two-component system, chemotaxis family, CheB/CheR fusion protein
MRVLIVDDNIDTAFLLAELVKLCGHEAETAMTSEEALTKGKQFDPELVFLDIGMPGCNGYRLAPKLRGEAGLTDARIVAYSGYKDDPDLRLTAGIDAHLLKPVSLERLKEFFDCEPLERKVSA